MAKQTQRMQKAMVQMNIKLHNVISDIHGATGSAILQAILEGERDAKILARLSNHRIKASRETLEKSLEGNWREEQLFNLKMAYDRYLFYESQLHECDKKCEETVARLSDSSVPEKQIKPLRVNKKQPSFNVAKYAYQTYGVDVTKIFGFKQTVALTVLSETGPDIKAKFPTEKQFLSWLNVVPDNKITGGKITSSKVKKKKNTAGQAFREAANGLWNAKNPFGDYLRHKKAKSGAGQAVVATARKIASVFYKMVTEKVEFDPYIQFENRQNYLEDKAKKLEKTLKKVNSLINDYQKVSELVI
jgi:hypothetical protein